MKIVAAEVFVTCPGRNFVTLKITTDDGIVGLGDATLNGRELSVASYLQITSARSLLAATRSVSKISGSSSTREPTGAAGR
ncbi:Starvation-sensing protein rspA [Raoultella terrigena]|uniref:Starvation-sensing protein rspA n=1 Tax=Raoultella terrigena TaxID=577 RepID=A0A4U9CX31_RAOTE|nr:Starvation-sensing protein rspA [Raoultella terrigena]